MATYKRNKSGGSQSEGASNSASPASSVALSNPTSSQGINNNAPKYGTLVPNRIFVGGISSNTTEAELCQLFSKYGNVKATKIIADRAGVSKGYGFVTFESEEEVKFLIQDANNIVLKERRLNIAPAIKKQPFSRSFDAASPPPANPNVYFHNGVPYTFHNGMAFFPPTAHQPALAALPPSDPSMYPPYGPTQNAAPAPYGTPVLVPAPPPVFMPQNYPYQPMPMTNGAATQFIYAGSGSSNSSSGSPLAGTPDNLSAPLHPHPQYYAQHYSAQEAYFPPPVYISYSYNSTVEFEAQEQQAVNEDCSTSPSTPHSDVSDRSSSKSPQSIPVHSQFMMIKNTVNFSGPCKKVTNNSGLNTANQLTQSDTDSQVPVVSWQNLKNHGEERELHIRDGRRAFHPIVPPPPPPPPMMLYQQPPYPIANSFTNPSSVYQAKQIPVVDSSRGHRQSSRGRSRYAVSANSIPFIPKFPASFNNNNPLTMNKNFHDKKPIDVSNGRLPRQSNNKGRGNSRSNHFSSPSSTPKPTNSFISSPSPQMMQHQQAQHYDRQYGSMERSMVVNSSAPRWTSNPPMTSNQIKRLVCNKRQNGSTQNLGVNNSGSVRLPKKPQGCQESVDGDLGGGGDAQPIVHVQHALASPPSSPPSKGNNSEITSKMQSLSLERSS